MCIIVMVVRLAWVEGEAWVVWKIWLCRAKEGKTNSLSHVYNLRSPSSLKWIGERKHGEAEGLSYLLGIQRVVHTPRIMALPGCLLEIQSLGSHSRPDESEPAFNKISRWYACIVYLRSTVLGDQDGVGRRTGSAWFAWCMLQGLAIVVWTQS